MLTVPIEVAAQLPKAGRTRVIVLTGEGADDEEWRAAADEPFLREDPPEDALDDSLRCVAAYAPRKTVAVSRQGG